jgi:iron complex outermembrane receptor protein
LPVEGLGLIVGARHDAYELNMDVYNSANYVAGSFNGFTSRSGGQTQVEALFAQLNYDIERLRFSIDPTWHGELPRSYFYAADDSFKAHSGILTEEKLQEFFPH